MNATIDLRSAPNFVLSYFAPTSGGRPYQSEITRRNMELAKRGNFCFELGHAASRAAKAAKNPYKPFSKEWFAWVQGFRVGEFDSIHGEGAFERAEDNGGTFPPAA